MRADVLARVVLVPGVLSGADVAALRRLPCDAPGELAVFLAEDVRAGRCKVARMVDGGRDVGFIVFEAAPTHELIVHAAFGRDDRANLVDVCLPQLDALARQCECDSVRFHTMRPGLVRRALAAGYHVGEVVMRKRIHRGE